MASICLNWRATKTVAGRCSAAGVIYDQSLDQWYSKIDQLPPFDISLLFSNEAGFASYQRILGVEFVTSADIYSIQDMMSEQTISYLASDFTPLLPLNASSFYQPAQQTALNKGGRTVADVWSA